MTATASANLNRPYQVHDAAYRLRFRVEQGEPVHVIAGPDRYGQLHVRTGDGRTLLVYPGDLDPSPAAPRGPVAARDPLLHYATKACGACYIGEHEHCAHPGCECHCRPARS